MSPGRRDPDAEIRPELPATTGRGLVANPLRMAVDTMVQNKAALTGIIVIILMALFSFIGPFFYHSDQVATSCLSRCTPPSSRTRSGLTTRGTTSSAG